MSAAIDPNFRYDDRWPEYREPPTAVAALLQMPVTRINAESLASAYMKDCRDARRATKGGRAAVEKPCEDRGGS